MSTAEVLHAEPIETAPSPSHAEIRRERGRELAGRLNIGFQNGLWTVPAQSQDGFYRVNLNPVANSTPMCTCPDFEKHGEPCKHVYAVQFVVQHEVRPDGTVTQTRTMTVSETTIQPPKRPTYRQAWRPYNDAQVNEKRRFQALLFELCKAIDQPAPEPKRGRRPLPLRDMAFAITYKVYTLFSSRRFVSDLEDASAKGYVSQCPHYNSVLNYLEDPAITPLLKALIVRSSLPLAAIEVDFAVDSTGFMASRFSRWFDQKYGKIVKKHDWVKLHFMTGVKTNVITAVEIKGKDAADCPMLPDLLSTTRQSFTIREVSADKAYLSLENANAIVNAGGTPYIAIKSNTTGMVGGNFESMYHAFCLNRDAYMAHYHKRSNAESTFSMVKAKFRDHVRAKTDTGMVNEALAKFVCHNLCCLIHATLELGIEARFWGKDDLDASEEKAAHTEEAVDALARM
jgi:transposase